MRTANTIPTADGRLRDPDGRAPAGSSLIQVQDPDGTRRWHEGRAPLRIIEAGATEDVLDALREIEAETQRGRTAVGFLAYEAAPAFDPALVCAHPAPLPLLWFAIYEELTPVPAPTPTGPCPSLAWTPSLDPDSHRRDIERIKEAIARGETYQVNHTFRLHAAMTGDPYALFTGLLPAQPEGYNAYLDTGDHVICSFSPELFFQRQGSQLRCRPMKGTVTRGRTTLEDQARSQWLQHSEKNRAENVMIVDMIRNDLGRVAIPGSVTVPHRFAVESYPTLFQLTSTVEAQSAASLTDILTALFPCASITGAPKVNTMKLIASLEREPRGIYTGAVGVIGPDDFAQFNVAIRTVHVDRRRQRAVYGTGGGIVWDSEADEEYRECSSKALVLRDPLPPVTLLMSMRWEPGTGIRLREEQRERVRDSARYFSFDLDETSLWAAIDQATEALTSPHKVRLLVGAAGVESIDVSPLDPEPFGETPQSTAATWKVAVAAAPVDARDRFLYHKTTHRQVYEEARRAWPECDDVLLYNRADRLTETCRANLVVQSGNRFLTPPLDQGLLNGTFRRKLLRDGILEEAPLPRSILDEADALYAINAVRGWVRLEPIDREQSTPL